MIADLEKELIDLLTDFSVEKGIPKIALPSMLRIVAARLDLIIIIEGGAKIMEDF